MYVSMQLMHTLSLCTEHEFFLPVVCCMLELKILKSPLFPSFALEHCTRNKFHSLSMCSYYHRKQWVKRQKIVHSYGEDEEECDTEEFQAELEQHMRDGTVPHCIPAQSEKPDSMEIVLGGKKCKCGSTTHQRISHRDCPLNKRNSSSQGFPNESETVT